MLSAGGPVKVTDFGIAKTLMGRTTTQTGLVLGTPFYMSPEQVQGLNLDGRSDQFALAVIAYQMLTGRRPFQGDQVTSICYQIVHAEPVAPAEINPNLPAGVARVLKRALAKDPAQRFPTCSEFATALAAACERGSTIAAPAPIRKATSYSKVSVGAISAAALLGGTRSVLTATENGRSGAKAPNLRASAAREPSRDGKGALPRPPLRPYRLDRTRRPRHAPRDRRRPRLDRQSLRPLPRRTHRGLRVPGRIRRSGPDRLHLGREVRDTRAGSHRSRPSALLVGSASPDRRHRLGEAFARQQLGAPRAARQQPSAHRVHRVLEKAQRFTTLK
jgi:hypothetical protein